MQTHSILVGYLTVDSEALPDPTGFITGKPISGTIWLMYGWAFFLLDG